MPTHPNPPKVESFYSLVITFSTYAISAEVDTITSFLIMLHLPTHVICPYLQPVCILFTTRILTSFSVIDKLSHIVNTNFE